MLKVCPCIYNILNANFWVIVDLVVNPNTIVGIFLLWPGFSIFMLQSKLMKNNPCMHFLGKSSILTLRTMFEHLDDINRGPESDRVFGIFMQVGLLGT